MNISIKNLDPQKIISAIQSEVDKINDVNLKLNFEWKIVGALHEIEDELDESISKRRKQLDKNTNLVKCPHCLLYNDIRALQTEACKHKEVKGTFTKSIDLGEWDGWRHETLPTMFMWAKCKYCGKKIYAPNDRFSLTPFNGRVYGSPEAFSR